VDSLIRIVTNKFAARSYPVHIRENLLDEVGRIGRGALQKGRAAIVSDTKVGDLYGERVSSALANEGFDYCQARWTRPGASESSDLSYNHSGLDDDGAP
jgi:3-dehydroquinate synthetase